MAGLSRFLRRIPGRRRRKRRDVDEDEIDQDVRSMTPDADSSALDTLHALRQFEKQHQLDPNLPLDELNSVEAILTSGDTEKGIEIEQALLEENSPYQEVRASIRTTDDDVPANTVRAWVIGMILCTIGSGFNMLFSLRSPSVVVTTFVIQLVAYPIGLFWDAVMPDKVWTIGKLRFNLRPGRFNVKEHVIITVMSNAAYGGGWLYATDVLVTQRVKYNQDFGWGFALLFGITTLCTGYGLAGIARRFLVWPASMIWPQNLVNATLFYALHDRSPSDPARTNGWSIGRYRWFLFVGVGSFVWAFFPHWIFTGLSMFAWITWIVPKNVGVNIIFGPHSGYGLFPLSFDWSLISGYIGSPLIPPFHAIANTIIGVVAFFIVLSMGLFYGKVWYSDYFPVQSSDVYANNGYEYSFTMILDENNHFDAEAYHRYSPLFLPTHFAIAYGLSFAAISAVIVHVALYHGKEIWIRLKLARNQEDDIHMKMMKKYREAPDWWYLSLYVSMVAMSLAVVLAWPTDLDWWAYVVCMLIPIVMLVPIGIIQAITNIQLGLNVLTEYIIGYMRPGRPLAMMIFKNYGYVTMGQALYFLQDLKLGHYMKVPPRTMFWAQVVASIWSAIVQISIMNWALGNIDDVCTPTAAFNMRCPNVSVFFNASVIWGVIGPARMFGKGSIYSGLQWFWLAGAVAPVFTWLLARRFPRSIWRYVNTPLIFGGSGWIPPSGVYNYLCWGIVGTIFNFFIKRRKTGWWLQYNYITSAALDCGLFIGLIVIFFALVVPKVGKPMWFGNKDIQFTLDYQGVAVLREVPMHGTIGPETWA